MTRAPRLPAAALIVAAACAGCRPALDDRPWLVTSPQIVGIKVEPAESPPGSEVSLQAITLDPAGPLDPAATVWSLCRSGKPLGENRVVAESCLGADPAAADALGSPATLVIPATACQLFGPDTPQPAPGAPPSRPRDPDATGGYYQPISGDLSGSLAIGLARITCGLPDASLAASRAFLAAYHANRNPTVTGLSFEIDGAAADPAAIPRGARVSIRAAWLDGDAEPFALFDRQTRTVVEQRESLAAAWYVTGGQLEIAAAEISDPAVMSAATVWVAPDAPGSWELVGVLRDSRGGSDAIRATLQVR